MKTGTIIRELSAECANTMRQTRLLRELADGSISKERYLGYIIAMYPIVVSFTCALNRMIGLFDPVLTSVRIFQCLYRQANEELAHNQLWRNMLLLHRIDHAKVYQDYKEHRVRNRMFMSDVVHCVASYGDKTGTPKSSASTPTPFPEPVHALAYWQEVTSVNRHSPWIHFACQSAMEATILDAVTSHIFPGVKNNSELNIGPESYRWWLEHTNQAEPNGKESTEIRHLNIAIDFLDSNVPESGSEELQEKIVHSAHTTLKLFAATMQWHDANIFDISPYLESSLIGQEVDVT